MTYQSNSWRHLVAPFCLLNFHCFLFCHDSDSGLGRDGGHGSQCHLVFEKRNLKKSVFQNLEHGCICYVVVGRVWFGSGWSGNAFLQYVVWEVLRRSRTHYCLYFPSCMFTHAAKVLLNKNMGGMTWNNAAGKTIRLHFCEWLRVFFFKRRPRC